MTKLHVQGLVQCCWEITLSSLSFPFSACLFFCLFVFFPVNSENAHTNTYPWNMSVFSSIT